MEEGVPLGAGGEQGVAGGFPGGSRQAVPSEAGDGRRLRAVLPGAAGFDTSRGTACGLGSAGGLRARDRAGEGVGEEPAVGDWISERDESFAGEFAEGGNPA